MKCAVCGEALDRPTLWPGMPLRHAATKQQRCHPTVATCPHYLAVLDTEGTIRGDDVR